jgi:hypothetical protein
MRGHSTHDFQLERELRLDFHAGAFLALVDPESYSGFVAPRADRLDLLQHLCHEMESLTAMMWEVPDALIRLHLSWASDDWSSERLHRPGLQPIANGSIRSSGQLCLANDAQLLASARDRRRDLLNRAGKNSPYLLLVPSGVYDISIYNGLGSRFPLKDSPSIGYTVVLNYHPHPAPRLHPVRLNGLMPFGGRLSKPLDHPEPTPDWHDSHKAPR